MACPAACEAPINWTRTRLADRVIEARLQLDPDGHPRVLLVVDTATDALVSKPQRSYRYASCDRGCSSESRWDETTIATALGIDASPAASNSFFALDQQGHPALIYRDTPAGPDDAGTFYLSCLAPRPSDCHSAAAWTKVALATGFPLTAPELLFTSSGEPRFLGEYIDAAQGIDRLVYGECDPHCTVGGSTQLFGAGPGASYSLVLDHDGRPRIVFDTGASSGGDALDAHQLYYLWCDASCTSPASWQDAAVPVLPGSGAGVSLAMDSHDHPRFAYQRGEAGPGLGWCDRDCESAHAVWSAGLIEATDALQRADPLRSSHRLLGVGMAAAATVPRWRSMGTTVRWSALTPSTTLVAPTCGPVTTARPAPSAATSRWREWHSCPTRT